MLPIILLLFILILIVLFIFLAFLQKRQGPIDRDAIFSKEELKEIKRNLKQGDSE